MSTELEQILQRLDSLEAKLDTLASQLMGKAAAPRTRHEIDEIMRYLSNSGNTTWKAFNQDGDIIYLRQAHKDMLIAAGLWDSLNAMRQDERCAADIVLYTVPDGDFMKPVEIEADGWVKVPERDNPGLKHLNELVTSQNYLVADTETTDLDGYVCQIAVIDHTGQPLLDTLVKPPVDITAEATAVHGITNEMVAHAPTMEELAPELVKLLNGQTVIGWNVKFDRQALNRSLPVPGLMNTTWTDAMEWFSPIYGEWSDYHGNYKWQKLTTAAAHYGIGTDGAHSAIADCRMTLEVIKKMVAES